MGGKRMLDSYASPFNTKGNGNANSKRNKAGNEKNGNNNNIDMNPAPPCFRKYTPTFVLVATIYNENENLGMFSILHNIKTPAHKRKNFKYYRYHRDVGHTTNECRVLKDEVEKLIQHGKLRNYVKYNNL